MLEGIIDLHYLPCTYIANSQVKVTWQFIVS